MSYLMPVLLVPNCAKVSTVVSSLLRDGEKQDMCTELHRFHKQNTQKEQKQCRTFNDKVTCNILQFPPALLCKAPVKC